MSETIETKKHIGAQIAAFLDLSVRPFLRSRMGGQRLSLPMIVAVFGWMFLLNGIANFSVNVPMIGHIGAHTRSEALRTYSLAFLIFALYQRRERRKEFRTGVEWHGQHSGVSHFEFLSAFISREWVYRYVDACVCFLAGYVVYHLGFSSLGICWILGAIGFGVTENLTLEAQEEQVWTLRNQNLDAMNLSATMDGRNASSSPPVSRPTSGSGSGVPTGLDDRLARDIRGRGCTAESSAPEAAEEPSSSPPDPLAAIKADRGSKITLAVGGGILGLALLFYNLGPSRAVEQVKQAALSPAKMRAQRPIPASAQATAGKAAPPAPFQSPQPLQGQAAATQVEDVVGTWRGNALLPRGSCSSQLDIAADTADAFTAFVTLNCRPVAVPPPQMKRGAAGSSTPPHRCLNSPYPVAGKFSGKPVGNTVELAAEKSPFDNTGDSSMTAARLSLIGSNRIAFIFTDDSGCGSAQMLLNRVRQ